MPRNHRPRTFGQWVDRNARYVFVALTSVAVVALTVVALDSTRPEGSQAALRDVAVAEPPADERPIVVFLGDSFAAGTGATTAENQWVSLVADAKNWETVNLARGGTGYLATNTFDGCGLEFCPNYSGMIPEAINAKPSTLVISGGQNDFNTFVTSRQSVVDAISSTFRQARTAFPDTRIVVVGPSTTNGVSEDFTQFAQTVQDSATGIGAEFISLTVPDAISPEMVLPDGGHVDDAGHRSIADRVLAGLG